MPFKPQTDHQKKEAFASFFVSRSALSPKGSFTRYALKASLRAEREPQTDHQKSGRRCVVCHLRPHGLFQELLGSDLRSAGAVLSKEEISLHIFGILE